MGLLTFSINVTLDGCVDHREGIADEEAHAFATFVEELKRAKDREEFDAFMARRRDGGAKPASA